MTNIVEGFAVVDKNDTASIVNLCDLLHQYM